MLNASLFYRFPQNVASCFKGKFLIAQLVAIALTTIIVLANIDLAYFEASRNDTLRTLIFPAIAIGGLLPIVLPLALLAIGTMRKRAYLVNTAWALGQSAILGSLISSTYKALTGRIPPRFAEATTNLADIGHGFQFGFMRGGIFWGWPSSHTTIAFAMAATLATLFPKQRILIVCAFIYAAYVAFGVSVSIHWLSEAVAGVIMGTVIGIVVGRSFLERAESTK